MARFLHAAVLALLPLLSGAIVLKEAAAPSQEASSRVSLANDTASQKASLIQAEAHAVVSVNATGIPFIATSVQLSLSQIMEPVKEKLLFLKGWIKDQLTDLEKAVNATKEMPDKALDEFASRFSDLFTNVQDKLEPVATKLSIASPAIDGLQKVLVSTGHGGAADKISDIMDGMSANIALYQKILSNSSEICDSLKGLGKKDWHQAGPKIAKLKVYLDKGTSIVKTFGDALSLKVSQALGLLSNKLGVEPDMFSPVQKAADDSWLELEDSTRQLSSGMTSSAELLPPKIAMAVDDPNYSGAAATGAMGAFAATAVALLL